MSAAKQANFAAEIGKDNIMTKKLCLTVALILAAIGWWSGNSRAISVGEPAPDIAGERWINSQPLTIGDLRGHVVMVEFWTFG